MNKTESFLMKFLFSALIFAAIAIAVQVDVKFTRDLTQITADIISNASGTAVCWQHLAVAVTMAIACGAVVWVVSLHTLIFLVEIRYDLPALLSSID